MEHINGETASGLRAGKDEPAAANSKLALAATAAAGAQRRQPRPIPK